MKKEWYQFANQFNLSSETIEKKALDEMAKKQYERGVLAAIHREQQSTQNNANRSAGKKHRKAIAAAACLLLLGGMSAIFNEEVHAAIARISYSLSTALGVESDIAQYIEIVNTSVSDKGYIVTLQEAAAAEEKLVVSYTIQHEDGQPFTGYFTLDGRLYINGSIIYGGADGSQGFLDDEHKIIGGETSYDVPDIDLSVENTYELKFTVLDEDVAKNINGHWDFKFKADGAELFADTKHMTLGNEFILPDGETITLDTFSDNVLEQRITFHSSKKDMGGYDVRLTATDEQGRTTEFYISRFGDGKGYMLNSKYLENGRIAADAKTITITVSAVKLPEDSGRMPDDYVQLGEPLTWDMTSLQ